MPRESTSSNKVPGLAALCTWLVPGGGHLYLGRPLFALLAFALVEGLYFAGWKLSGGMTFEFLDPELRSRFATVLTPEVGNLGAFVMHMQNHPFGPSWPSDAIPRPWPDTVMIGSLLSALSGLVNGCLMVHAHVLARARRPVLAATLAAMPAAKLAPELAPARHPALFVACTWLVPGLGHWLQGRKLRAAIVFVLLVGLFALGTLLSEGSNLSRERHFYFWSGQFLLGLPAIAVELLSGRPPVTHDIEWADAGLTFACIAGLLNVLAMLDVYAWAEELWFGRDPLASSEVRADAARPAPGAAAK